MNNKVYIISDELLNEDVYSTIRSDLQKYWTPSSSKKEQPERSDTQSVQQRSELRSVDYTSLIPVLQSMMFDKNELKLINKQTKQNIYKDIEKLISSLKTKSPETFIVLEQQKVTNRTTIDLSKIVSKYNLSSDQLTELKQFIINFVNNVNSDSKDTKFTFVDKNILNQPTVSTKDKTINQLFEKLKTTKTSILYNDWIKLFNELLKLNKNYTTTVRSNIQKMFQNIANTYSIASKPPQDKYYNQIHDFFEKQILIPLKYNREQIIILVESFFYSLYKYFDRKLSKSTNISESFDITSIHIDFTKSKQLNESFLVMFGTAIKTILQRMFGQDVFMPPMTITGNKQQMETFVNALAGEKRYFDSYVQYGLNDPRTYQDKYKLQAAVNDFERNTGIKWPFK